MTHRKRASTLSQRHLSHWSLQHESPDCLPHCPVCNNEPTIRFRAEGALSVFAAASVKNALDDINASFTQSTEIEVVATYAGSSALVQQIETGAAADVFVSADMDWMDYGIEKKVINVESCFYLLGNRLVLIAPKDSKLGNVAIGPGFDLAQLVGNSRIATGDVRMVPVGIYAKKALERLGLWDAVAAKFTMTEDVRAALALVARGEASLAIVYATDAKVEPRVKIIGTFPAGSHPAIVYPAAETLAAKPEAATYLSYLHSETAKAVFEKYGFFFLKRLISCR
jgi:molybdate transport system substrate-binding protein